MDEFTAALGVVFAPVKKAIQLTVVDPSLLVSGFWIDFFSRYVVDSRLGHVFVRTVLAPSMTYSLARVYDARDLFRIFGNAPDSTRIVAAGVSSLFNIRLLNDPVKQIISNVGTVYCDVMYGREARNDAFLFFYMGTYQTGRLVGLEAGTGDINDPNNCYYPKSLSIGPLPMPNRGIDEALSKKIKDFATTYAPADDRERYLEKFTIKRNNDIELTAGTLKELAQSFILELNKSRGEPFSQNFQLSGQQRWNTDRNLEPSAFTSQYSGIQVPITTSETKDQEDQQGSSVDADSADEVEKQKKDNSNSGPSFIKPSAVVEWSKLSEMAEKSNLEIAMSCLFFSMLTYETDAQLEECRKNGMLKDVDIYSVDTGSSGTQMIVFLNVKQKFAVFGYRGTQFEVIRQMLTSLDFRLEYFETNDECSKDDTLGLNGNGGVPIDPSQRAHIRKVYLNEVMKASEIFKFQQPIGGEKLSPLSLIKYLNKLGDYKIYLTGHSLGGGLSTVMAARLMSLKIKFDAVVTFGATPVGDSAFVKWFNKHVPCSWRFVFGDEFAPMVPPIPWAIPTQDIKLVHVGHFYHLDLPKRPVPVSAKEADKVIETLAFEAGMMDLIVHHNPWFTMRGLKYFHANSQISSCNRLRLDIGGDDSV